MKIIDENGAAIETPDLTLGYLVDDTEPVEHPAVEGVEEVSHYETVTEYPGALCFLLRCLILLIALLSVQQLYQMTDFYLLLNRQNLFL